MYSSRHRSRRTEPRTSRPVIYGWGDKGGHGRQRQPPSSATKIIALTRGALPALAQANVELDGHGTNVRHGRRRRNCCRRFPRVARS